ncbi:MAG: hypothetical protein QM820_56915 [Minicystis sp.]
MAGVPRPDHLFMLVAAVALGCSSSAKPNEGGARAASSPTPSLPEKPAMSSSPSSSAPEPPRQPPPGPIDCLSSLQALAAGRLDDFPGLGPNCRRRDADSALGSSGTGPDDSGVLGGSPTAFRRHPPSVVAPHGITVWYAGDRIVLIDIVKPVLPRPLEGMLGPPEAKMPSRIRGYHTQWVYAARGLAVHVKDSSGEVEHLYAFGPTTVDEHRDSYRSKLGETRRRPDP